VTHSWTFHLGHDPAVAHLTSPNQEACGISSDGRASATHPVRVMCGGRLAVTLAGGMLAAPPGAE